MDYIDLALTHDEIKQIVSHVLLTHGTAQFLFPKVARQRH